MKIEFRVIPGFSRHEITVSGIVRTIGTKRIIRTHRKGNGDALRVNMRGDDGERGTRNVGMLIALAWGIEHAPKRRNITDAERPAVLAAILSLRGQGMILRDIAARLRISQTTVQRTLAGAGQVERRTKAHRTPADDDYGVWGYGGPEEWEHVKRSAAARDAVMAAAGRFDQNPLPEWLLEKELRCLRREPSRPPTHVPSAGSASWAA